MIPSSAPLSPVTLAPSPDLKPDLKLDAAEQRRRNPDFLARAAITTLADRLPLPRSLRSELAPSLRSGQALSVAEGVVSGQDVCRWVAAPGSGRALWVSRLEGALRSSKELNRRGRNAAERRNARLEEWSLKRLPVFGRLRSQATIFLADLWGNLLQMARLIKEATLAKLTLPKLAP